MALISIDILRTFHHAYRMKDLEKFLHSAKKLEARHTNRKTREAEEVYTFNIQKEYHRNREFDRLLEFDATYAEFQNQRVEPLLDTEQEALTNHNEVLDQTEDFAQEMAEVRQHAPENAFDIIAELQGFDLDDKPHRLKQLPPGSSADIFAHEMSDLIEEQLQKETAHNERAIEKGHIYSEEEPEYWEMEEIEDDEQEAGLRNVFYFRPVKPRRK